MWRLDVVVDDSSTWEPLLPAMEQREVVLNAALMLWLNDVEIAHVRVVENDIYPMHAPYLSGDEEEMALIEYYQIKARKARTD